MDSIISEKFKNKESDVVYKIKDKNIFLLIEHQSKIDDKMPKRILDYEIETIYTGRRKWDVAGYIQDCRKKSNRLESFRLGNYYIIYNNTYTDKLVKEIARKSRKEEGGNDMILERFEFDGNKL